MKWRQVATGDYHSCAIASDGSVYCWGGGWAGQIGNGATSSHNIPVRTVQGDMPAGVRASYVSAGESHTCALASDDRVYCWGKGEKGRLGDGSNSNKLAPSKIAQGVSGLPSGERIMQIAAGNHHTCGVTMNGRAYCWGDGGAGRLGNGSPDHRSVPTPVAQGEVPVGVRFIQIAAGNEHTCALASDSRAYCWGNGSDGRLGNNGGGPNSPTPTPVAQGEVPVGVRFTQIAAGESHTCALASDGRTYCWGRNEYSQLGTGNTSSRSTPARVTQGALPTNARFLRIALGNNHTCALASDSRAYCWGKNNDGQLGTGNTSSRSTPARVTQGGVPTGVGLVEIGGGYHQTCSAASNGEAYCWGQGYAGRLGNGTYETKFAPTAVRAVSSMIPVAQTSYRLYQPSANSSPGTPLASANTTATLSSVGGDFRARIGMKNEAVAPFMQVAAANEHTCALASNNKAYCWGSGGQGRLGNGSSSDKSTPSLVAQGELPSNAYFTKVTAGTHHTCALASNDKAYCWGSGGQGRLGNGSSSDKSTPSLVAQGELPNDAYFTHISVGVYHTCALASNNKIYCWGYGGYMHLGNGSSSDKSTPSLVAQGELPSNAYFTKVTAGTHHTCALASNDKAYCWGSGGQGRLGNGSSSDKSTPSLVAQGELPNDAYFTHISARGYHTCALASNNKAYCWGDGGQGRLGNGSTSSKSTPTIVAQGELPFSAHFTRLFAGTHHTCALASNNKAYCWGSGGQGRLGNGSSSDKSTPSLVAQGELPNDAYFTHISARGYHTCALASNNKAYCWGDGGQGRLGNGAIVNQSTATQVTPVGPAITANTAKLRVEYAQKTSAAQCGSLPGSSWQQVTTTSPLAYATSGPVHTAAITAHASDPALPQGATGYSHQSIVRPSGGDLTFTNNRDIASGQVGLWDVVLTDRSLTQGWEYCIRFAADTQAAPGTTIDTYTDYPVIKAAVGSLDIRFTNAANTTLTNPTTSFGSITVPTTVRLTSGYLSGAASSNQQIEVSDTRGAGGWSVSLSATGGAAARWQNATHTANYPFNARNRSQGQLGLVTSEASFSARGIGMSGQVCDVAGLSFGDSVGFRSGTGTASAVTVATAAANSKVRCAFRMHSVRLNQTIPAYQRPDIYTLPMTLTITAQ
ncbi:MAG: hypothetical protein Q4A34_02540 [Candidatus Saccharibacteria bacterium]|nr:hypothetical protein [Candidatus Saccharibacteria bacterium]